jgi:hypothetical protein
MNISRPYVILLGLCFLASGCEEFQQSRQPQAKIAKESRVPVRRFILTKFNADVAFDTQTGQLCKTWEWTPLGKELPTDKNTGARAPRTLGEFSPTCVSLYKDFPSGTGTTSENLPDE